MRTPAMIDFLTAFCRLARRPIRIISSDEREFCEADWPRASSHTFSSPCYSPRVDLLSPFSTTRAFTAKLDSRLLKALQIQDFTLIGCPRLTAYPYNTSLSPRCPSPY